MDGPYLSVRQYQNLSYEQQQQYIADRIAEESDVRYKTLFCVAPTIIALLFQDEDPDDESFEEALAIEGIDEASDVEEHGNIELDANLFEISDEEDDQADEDCEKFVSRDGTQWQENPPVHRKKLSHNIMTARNTGPTPATKSLEVCETFKLLISDEIISIIVRESNRKAQFDNDPDKFTAAEIYAFIGLMLHAGASRSNRENLKDLWQRNAHPIYRATMSRNRFSLILKYIRFDNGATREARLRADKAAAISDIFAMLNDNLLKCYVAGENVTVDEQLYPFRGRTRFTQYIPSKPAKYGIKVWWVNDSQSYFPLKGQIYTGLSPTGDRDVGQGERVVKDLCVRMFKGSGRNITCDNFFTTFKLAKTLMIDHNLSILGTVNKKRRFLPSEMLPSKEREILTTRFAYSGNISLCSYVPKKNKAVVLLSTSHYSKDIVDDKKKKPQMIADYNQLKGGTDTMDHMLGEYSCHRKTNRWTLAFFYNILDVGALAAYTIYMENNPQAKKLQRRNFLKDLAIGLCIPEVEKRRNSHCARFYSTRSTIDAVLGKPPISKVVFQGGKLVPIRSTCFVCKDLGVKKSTRTLCSLCTGPVCAQHYKKIISCENCELAEEPEE